MKDSIENTVDADHFVNVHFESNKVSRVLLGNDIFSKLFFNYESISQNFISSNDKNFIVEYIIKFKLFGLVNYLKITSNVNHMTFAHVKFEFKSLKWFQVFSTIKISEKQTKMCSNLYLDRSFNYFQIKLLKFLIERANIQQVIQTIKMFFK